MVRAGQRCKTANGGSGTKINFKNVEPCVNAFGKRNYTLKALRAGISKFDNDVNCSEYFSNVSFKNRLFYKNVHFF